MNNLTPEEASLVRHALRSQGVDEEDLAYFEFPSANEIYLNLQGRYTSQQLKTLLVAWGMLNGYRSKKP